MHLLNFACELADRHWDLLRPNGSGDDAHSLMRNVADMMAKQVQSVLAQRTVAQWTSNDERLSPTCAVDRCSRIDDDQQLASHFVTAANEWHHELLDAGTCTSSLQQVCSRCIDLAVEGLRETVSDLEGDSQDDATTDDCVTNPGM